MAYIKADTENINKVISWDLCNVFLNNGNGLKLNNLVKNIHITIEAGDVAYLDVETFINGNSLGEFVGEIQQDISPTTTKHRFPLRYLKAIATGAEDMEKNGLPKIGIITSE